MFYDKKRTFKYCTVLQSFVVCNKSISRGSIPGGVWNNYTMDILQAYSIQYNCIPLLTFGNLKKMNNQIPSDNCFCMGAFQDLPSKYTFIKKFSLDL